MRGPHCDKKAFRSACTLLLLSLTLHAQTLARRNWAGSGLSAEPWWRSAVFYRIEPPTFQDSDGDGKGDLRGIAQRMAYLQSLSVDAVVLQSPFEEEGFDDLLREASSHHIRLLVALSSADNGSLANAARSWLTRGCAGVWLQVPAHAGTEQTTTALQTLRKLTESFPGQRVLVEDTSADPAALALAGAQLVTRSLVAGVNGHTDALSLRVQVSQLSNLPAGSTPVILLGSESLKPEDAAERRVELNRILASALFLSRGATSLSAGQEIGSDTTTAAAHNMQWTPSNVTRPPEAQAAAEAPPPPQRRPENEYGSFVPYVAPKKIAAASAPDLNALPGFSSVAIVTKTAYPHDNVASEDADANSVLNFYRRLSQLHHGNATLYTGTTIVLNRDADDALVWIRRSARAAAGEVVAANLTDATETISLAPDIVPHSRTDALLPVLSSSPLNVQVLQRSAAITLAPWSVVVLAPDR